MGFTSFVAGTLSLQEKEKSLAEGVVLTKAPSSQPSPTSEKLVARGFCGQEQVAGREKSPGAAKWATVFQMTNSFLMPGHGLDKGNFPCKTSRLISASLQHVFPSGQHHPTKVGSSGVMVPSHPRGDG